jgi:hypothetical protein
VRDVLGLFVNAEAKQVKAIEKETSRAPGSVSRDYFRIRPDAEVRHCRCGARRGEGLVRKRECDLLFVGDLSQGWPRDECQRLQTNANYVEVFRVSRVTTYRMSGIGHS